MEKMDPELVKQWRRGFEEAEAVIEQEKRIQLPRMTVAESLEIFRRLYAFWGKIEGQTGGYDLVLDDFRSEETMAFRDRFNQAGGLKFDS